MGKKEWMAEHERLVGEMMERTGCDWTTAYEAVDGREVDRRVADRMADMIDEFRSREKERF